MTQCSASEAYAAIAIAVVAAAVTAFVCGRWYVVGWAIFWCLLALLAFAYESGRRSG